MADLNSLIERIERFRSERDWKQFHNPKDLALSLILESAEVIEHFQWKTREEIEEYVKENKDEIGEEIADVLYCVLLLSLEVGVDVAGALERKMEKNEKKYPVEKAKGKHTKYNKL